MNDCSHIDPQLSDLLSAKRDQKHRVLISCHQPFDDIKKLLNAHGVEIDGQIDAFNILKVRLGYEHLAAVAAIDGIEWVELDAEVSINL